MKYKLVIFDLDGTVLDTLKDLSDAVNFALKKNELPMRSMCEVRDFVGNGIRLLIERAVPDNTPDDITDKVFSDFKEYYAVHSCDTTIPYEGITDMLCELRKRGMKTAVVSNKADFAVKILVKQYFDGLFDESVGERENIAKKPAPDSVTEVLKVLDTDKEYCVYVGDSEVDIRTAENVGIPCISVSWGFRSRERLIESGAQNIVSDVSQLLEQLTK